MSFLKSLFISWIFWDDSISLQLAWDEMFDELRLIISIFLYSGFIDLVIPYLCWFFRGLPLSLFIGWWSCFDSSWSKRDELNYFEVVENGFYLLMGVSITLSMHMSSSVFLNILDMISYWAYLLRLALAWSMERPSFISSLFLLNQSWRFFFVSIPDLVFISLSFSF